MFMLAVQVRMARKIRFEGEGVDDLYPAYVLYTEDLAAHICFGRNCFVVCENVYLNIGPVSD